MNINLVSLKKAIPAALMLAGALGLSSNANASAYAISYNNVYNLAVTSTASDGTGGPFYVPLSAFTDFTSTSSVTANFNGTGDAANPANSDSQGGPSDANIAYGNGSVFPGVAPTNNLMVQQGQAGNYSYGDAQVITTALLQPGVGDDVTASGSATHAWNIAEAFVASAPATNTADSAGLNSSETGITTTIALTGDAIFNFDFSADPYMAVAMSADSLGGTANANLDVTFTITRDNGDGTSTTVFEWAPDGQAGGIMGGVENLDPFSLNGSIECTVASCEGEFRNGRNPDGTVNPGASGGVFSATTLVLAAGTYTIAIDMSENVNIRTAADVPEPGVLALMGLGLAGLGFSRRRKAARS